MHRHPNQEPLAKVNLHIGPGEHQQQKWFDKKIYQKHSKNIFQLYRIQTKEIHLIEIVIVCISNDSHVNPPLKCYKRLSVREALK